MKDLFKILFLLPFLTMAQVNIDNQWKTSVNPNDIIEIKDGRFDINWLTLPNTSIP